MSDKPGSPKSDYSHHDGKPGSAADRSAKVAVPDTFPASDPAATTGAVGSRAVDPAEMMDASGKPDIPDAATVTARFRDHVAAKLVIEKLVRAIPMDRRLASISEEGGATLLTITAPRADKQRVEETLRESGGEVR
jgi:hypothetical protein